MKKEYDVMGIGNLLVDYVIEVDDSVLDEFNLQKGIMHEKDRNTVKRLESKIENIQKYPGGSVPNVTHGISNLYLKAAFAGSASYDENGKFFVDDLKKSGVKNCVQYKWGNTGVAASLVTPDGERTFMTNYGVASNYSKKDIDKDTLKKSKFLHFSGYEYESMNKTIRKAVKTAYWNYTNVSFDLGDPNLVLRHKDDLKEILKKTYVVFANEEEALNFSGAENPETALEVLSKYCKVSVVKLGKEGVLAKYDGVFYKAKGHDVPLVNTIGAGDAFAAGFLYGLCKEFDIGTCCKLGNYYAARIVQEEGARLSRKMRYYLESYV